MKGIATQQEEKLHADIAAAWAALAPFDAEVLGSELNHEFPEIYEALAGRRPLEVGRDWGTWMEAGSPMLYLPPRGAAGCLGIYLLAALECRALRREKDAFLLDQRMAAHLSSTLEDLHLLKQMADGPLTRAQMEVTARFMQWVLDEPENLQREGHDLAGLRAGLVLLEDALAAGRTDSA